MTVRRTSDATPSFWSRKTPDSGHHISLLRPASLPKSERFESVLDARGLSRARQEKILTTDRALAEMLRDCGRGAYVCDCPACPQCARRFRIWLTAQGLEVYEQLPGHESWNVTIYLASVPEGQLPGVSIQQIHAALRQRLNRAGLGGTVLIGGTELAYRAKQREWLLHVHLLGLGLKREPREGLKKALLNSSRPKALKLQKINSPAAQISYLQKFTTLHRPGVQRGNYRARAYPLPPAPFAELMAFYANHEFTDFLFLFGARRRGARIVLEAAAPKQTSPRLRDYVSTRAKQRTKKSKTQRK